MTVFFLFHSKTLVLKISYKEKKKVTFFLKAPAGTRYLFGLFIEKEYVLKYYLV